MIRQRWTIGLGLGILLAIGAAATALDIKSRHDAGWVEHTLEVLQKISELRLRLRQVESASRGFALTRSPDFVAEFEDARKNIPAVATDLQRAVQDNPAQLTRLAKIRDLIARRIAASGELVRLSTASDGAGVAALQARPEGRASQTEIAGQLDAFATEEKRLLDERTATSRANGALL